MQVAGERQGHPWFLGCSELQVLAAVRQLCAQLLQEKGILKISVTVAVTACRLCGNSLLGKLSCALIFCNDTCISSPRLLWASFLGFLISPEWFLRMQELIFGHLFENCGFLACVLLFCEEQSVRMRPEPGPGAGR